MMGKGWGWGDLLNWRLCAALSVVLPPFPLPIKGRARVSPASRGFPLKVRKGTRSAGRPSGVLLCCYRFDEARRSAQPLSASLPSGGPVQALPGPGRLGFPRLPAVEEDEPIQAKTHPFAFNHADGGRVSPASSAPDRSSIPLEPSHARPPPAAANGRWPCALSSRRGGTIVRVISTPGIGWRVKVTRH
ncbi:hypothetical protein [Caulobacter vibrioides]|uniref:Uncharacterized protein n=2 Tax=Caulobacter vibrioides TaxID=155892 RepID=Q9A6B7_CAUVC|nr:hypothetical protein [Caulobacter vibrioides]YP_002517632.1 hypothetical protein CCNA_02259 [Caulobacter vibrioides NA1000]AAK24148.1 hypothetical protein CC_2177 [Caulobacter vibrioides CB15]ACL95724.1 hypothetical protein CCNA_02259 [Caulobacter vibrioides NA1000]